MKTMKKHESAFTNHQAFSISGDKKHLMRVYELAKQLGMESRKLIPELLRIGIQVTSHFNTLAEADAQKALNALSGQSQANSYEKAPPNATRTPAGEATLPSKSKPEALKNREWTQEKMPVFSAAVEDPPKPEKKHILVKQRKETEYLLPLPGLPEGVLGADPSAPLNPGSLIMKKPLSIAEPPSVFNFVCPAENGLHQQRKMKCLLMLANTLKYLAKAPSARLAIIVVILCLLPIGVVLVERPVGLLADSGMTSSLPLYQKEPEPLPRNLTEPELVALTVYMEAKDVDLAATQALEGLDEPLRELVLQTLTGSQQAIEKLVMRNDPRSWPPPRQGLGQLGPGCTAGSSINAQGTRQQRSRRPPHQRLGGFEPHPTAGSRGGSGSHRRRTGDRLSDPDPTTP